MMNNRRIRVCSIFNTPAHYCQSIYALMDKTFDCKFVFGDDFPSVKKFDTSILKNCEFVHYRYLKKILIIPGVIKYAFKHYDYYIINPSTNCVTMWLFFLIVKLFPSKKIFTWTHGMYGNESSRQLLLKKLQNKLCDGEFVYGDYAISLMKHKGFKSEKLFPIHNSLDYNQQLKLREDGIKSRIYEEHFGNSNPVIVMIGRLNKRKKLPMMLEVADCLNNRNSYYNYVFVGDGEERANLEKLVIEKKISSQVWFYGACYDEKKNAELIYNADICVMPGDIGLTAIHSLMFGLPVITHDCFSCHGPEFEVIRPGITGDFFKSADVDSMANSIEKWINSKTQDREQVRKACYEIIDKEWNPNYQLSVLKSVLV